MSTRGVRSGTETYVPETTTLRIGGTYQAYTSIDSGISFGEVQSSVYREPAAPRRTHQRLRHVPLHTRDEEIELQPYSRQDGIKYEWNDSPDPILTRPSAVALPSLRVTTTPFTHPSDSALNNSSRLLAPETTPSSATPSATWSAVRDPVALMGLSRHTGLVGVLAPGKIVGLPPKVLHAIFDKLDPCTATCLGLTCRKLYQFSKFAYPETISLYEVSRTISNVNGDFRITLGDLLEVWVGPLYRRRMWKLNSIQTKHAQLPPQFLLRDIYGSSPGDPKEVELEKRYLEYHRSQRSNGTQTFHILPYPFNKGAGYWYVQAKDCIKEDAKDFRGRPLWDWNQWMSFWMPSELFATVSYMDKLRVLQWFEEMYWRDSMQVLPGGSLLQVPSIPDRLWWCGKRYIRWVSWWFGNLPMREPYPYPRPEAELRRTRREYPLRADSLLLSRRYT